MKDKLKVMPLVLQLPVGQGHAFKGVIDLVTMELLLWEPGSDGEQFSTLSLVKEGRFPRLSGSLPVDQSVVEAAIEERSRLADTVSDEWTWLGLLHILYLLRY